MTVGICPVWILPVLHRVLRQNSVLTLVPYSQVSGTLLLLSTHNCERCVATMADTNRFTATSCSHLALCYLVSPLGPCEAGGDVVRSTSSSHQNTGLCQILGKICRLCEHWPGDRGLELYLMLDLTAAGPVLNFKVKP